MKKKVTKEMMQKAHEENPLTYKPTGVITTKQAPPKPEIKIIDDDETNNSEVNIEIESWGDDEYEIVTEESEKEEQEEVESA